MTSLIHHLKLLLSSVSREPLIVSITQHQGASVQPFCPLRKTNKSTLCQVIKWETPSYEAGLGNKMEKDQLLCL